MAFPTLAPLLFSGLLGSQQIAPPAPAVPMGAPQPVASDNVRQMLELARQNNFGGGIFGGVQSSGAAPGPTQVDTMASKEQAGNDPGFFGRLDKTLSSPSKTLGLGLLSQVDPRLGLLGLLASGIKFGGR